MKKYETPIAEKLEFNYADVVTASGVTVTLAQNSDCEGSPIVNPSGFTEKGNKHCEKLEPMNNHNWNQCAS